ncbi:MAG: hypothetical protein ACI9B7_001503 [Oleispira sp.]
MFDILKPLLLILLFLSFNCFSQDPMKPPSWLEDNQPTRAVEPETLHLQQILSSKNRKIAVINNTLVVEGQIIGGAKVAEITNQWVKVIYKGRSTTLTMTATTKEYNREK